MSIWKRKPPEGEDSLEKIVQQLASLKETIQNLKDMLGDPRLDDRRKKVVREQLDSLTKIYEKLSELHRRAKG